MKIILISFLIFLKSIASNFLVFEIVNFTPSQIRLFEKHNYLFHDYFLYSLMHCSNNGRLQHLCFIRFS